MKNHFIKASVICVLLIVLLTLQVSADPPKDYINEPISTQVINISGTYNFTYYYDNDVLIAEEDQTGKKIFYHPDNLGSTTLVTNESGEEVETIFYLPFGDLDNTDTDKRYLYTGKEKDKSTGSYYYGARYYDTDLMTFITPEQDIPNLYNPQDLNHYTYVRNNPYKYVDPNGEFVDTALDVAFIVSDVAILIDDPSTDNAIALGLDVAGAVIPFVTGVGKIYKIGKAIDKAKDVAQVSEKGKAVSKAVDKTGDVAKSGEKASNIGRATAKSREISFSERQLQSKYKHASDFGIEGNYNKENAQRYKQALENFVSSKDTQVIQGTYRGEKGTHFYNEKTGRYIFRDAKGEFRTGFRLGEKQRKSLRTIGSVR